MSGLARKNTRFCELFTTGWEFHLGDMAASDVWQEKEWRPVELPHDWSRDYPYDKDAPCMGTGGYVVTGIGWYRKKFCLDASDAGRKIVIQFEGVYMDSTVYVNGQQAGGHYSGYTPFEIDVTDLVCLDGGNEIAVRVNNGDQPNSRWYTGSGITRDVWIKKLAPVHVATYGVQVRMTDLTDVIAKLDVNVAVANDTDAPQRVTVRNAIYNAEGVYITDYAAQMAYTVQPGETLVYDKEGIGMPHLWSVKDPYLYTCVTSLIQNGEVVDEYTTRFGLRTLEYSPRKGLLLNGEHVKVIGGAVHHDGGGVGAAVPKKVWDRRLRILKEAGFNGIRTAHNTPDEGLLEACDEQGFLVMDEAFDEWRAIKETKSQMTHGMIERGYGERFDEEWEYDLTVTVKRDRNHPSIIMWSIANEVPEQEKPEGPEIVRAMKKIIRELDDRPFTAGNDHIVAEPLCATDEYLNELDIVGYNYVGRWRKRAETFYMDDRLAHPDWLQVGTENGGVRGSRRGHYLLEGDPGVTMRTQPYNKLVANSAALFRYTMTRDFVIGDYMWTLIDHHGEARWPARGSNSGVMDTCGFVKDSWYFYRAHLRKDVPTLHIMPHWNMDVEEDRIIPVMVYSSAPTVELFVNGKSYGKKTYDFPKYGMTYHYGNGGGSMATTNDLFLSWDVEFEKGKVEAVSYDADGNEAARAFIETTGAAKSLGLEADDVVLAADGRDICQIEVSAYDEEGRFVPDADNMIKVEVTGAASLAAVDNGDNQSKIAFTSDKMPLFGGKLLITVRAGREAGKARVRVSGRGIGSRKIDITVK